MTADCICADDSCAESQKACRDPGSNRGPSDLQSDALPAELSRLWFFARNTWLLTCEQINTNTTETIT